MITTVVFDLDDTLYPEKQFAFSGFCATDRFLRENYGIQGFSEIAHKVFNYGLRGNIFNVAFDCLGINDLMLLHECVCIYRDHRPQLELFGEASDIIQYYKSKRNLAIITDGLASVQQSKVEALDLHRYINPIVFTDLLGEGCSKPNPEAYKNVMNFFGEKGENCVYVGDNPNKDFIGARQLGWATVRVRRPGGEHAWLQFDSKKEADITISNLLELKTIIPA